MMKTLFVLIITLLTISIANGQNKKTNTKTITPVKEKITTSQRPVVKKVTTKQPVQTNTKQIDKKQVVNKIGTKKVKLNSNTQKSNTGITEKANNQVGGQNENNKYKVQDPNILKARKLESAKKSKKNPTTKLDVVKQK